MVSNPGKPFNLKNESEVTSLTNPVISQGPLYYYVVCASRSPRSFDKKEILNTKNTKMLKYFRFHHIITKSVDLYVQRTQNCSPG